ncbi:glycosyltransferase family 4 protein [Tenacibaculum sp. C7A-26P2]|uniref:glycosyltransferase family 4 protein n=1 Tax=Tenacibaculum sp. C7A-26P2 TaxID=3447504 RepID=UPI003F85004A
MVKKKVFIVTTHSTFESGGVGTHLSVMNYEFTKSKFDFNLILGFNKTEKIFYKIIDFVLKKTPFSPLVLIFRAYLLYSKLKAEIKKQDIKSLKIISHDKFSSLAGILVKFSLLKETEVYQVLHAPFSEQFLITNKNNKDLFGFSKFLDVSISKLVDGVIGVDDLQLNIEQGMYDLKNDFKGVVVSNAVNILQLDNVVNKRKNHNEDFIIIARHLHKKNGVEYGIEGFLNYYNNSKNNKFKKIIVIGDGPLREDLEKKFKIEIEKGIVILKGRVDNKEALELINNASLSIIPSIPVGNYIEATSLTMLESMYIGTPVIASNIGGLADTIVNNEDGILVEPREPIQIADSILELEKNEEKYQKIISNSRQKVIENYSSGVWFDKIIKFIN